MRTRVGQQINQVPPRWAAIASSIIVRHALSVLIVAAFAAAFALSQAQNLTVATNLETLMPEGTPSVQTLRQVLKRTGSFSSLQVVAVSEDQDASLRYMRDLKRHVDELDWVELSQYSEDLSVFADHRLLYVHEDRLSEFADKFEDIQTYFIASELEQASSIPLSIQIRSQPPDLEDDLQRIADDIRSGDAFDRNSDGGEKLFRSTDGQTTALVVWPESSETDVGTSRRMVSALMEAVDGLSPSNYAADMKVGVGGRIRNRVAQFDAVIADVKASLVTSVAVILALIALFYRRLAALIYIVLPLGVGIVWTLGFTAFAVGGLNLVTVFLALILFGLGIDFGIHNLGRYAEARKSGLSLSDALGLIIGRTGSASLAAMLTTAAGFLSLSLTDFRAFSEFGLIAGSGILLIFVSMYTVFPALIAILDPIRVLRPFGGVRRRTVRLALPFPAPLLTIGIGIATLTLAVISAQNVGFEKNFRNLQAAQSEDQLWTDAQIARVFPDGHDRAVLVVDTIEEVAAVTDYFEKYVAADTASPTIKKVESLLDVVPLPDVQARRLELIRDIERQFPKNTTLLEQGDRDEAAKLLATDAITLEELPPALRRTLIGIGDPHGYLIYIFNSVTMDDADLAQAFYRDAARLVAVGKTYAPASEAFVFVEMIALMKADASRAIALVLGVTVIIVALLFRSLSDVAMVLIPPVAGLVGLLGIMGAFGIKLSIINMVILPSILGIGMDNGIHILHRFREEGRAQCVRAVMHTTGRSAMLATLTTLLSFAGMLSASMEGLRSLGLVAVIGLSGCLLASCTLLPAVMQLQANWRGRSLSSDAPHKAASI